jgi:hypothetical protein
MESEGTKSRTEVDLKSRMTRRRFLCRDPTKIQNIDDKDIYDPDCDCYRRRGYSSTEIRWRGWGQWRNIGDYLAWKFPSYQDLPVGSEYEED